MKIIFKLIGTDLIIPALAGGIIGELIRISWQRKIVKTIKVI
jgi:hypothetical protein